MVQSTQINNLRRVNTLGQSLVELLVAIGIASAILPAVITGFVSSREGSVNQDLRLRATAYLREAEEAVRVVREKDWNTFAINGTYYPAISGSTWALINGTQTISDFTRFIEILDVDPIDHSVKKILFTVSWGPGSNEKVISSIYLTRYLDNKIMSETQTVLPDAGGFGNWCNPSQSITSVDLSRQGVPTSVWAFESGDGTGNRVFAGTGQNASGKPFTNTKILGNSPSITTLSLGDYNEGGTKATAVFGSESYAYIATDKKATAMIILDLNQYANPPTNNLYKKIGGFSTTENNANSVFVSGNTAYLTTNKLYTVNIADKINPIGLGVFNLDGVGTKVIVNNNIAYVAISGSSTKLQLINVSNPNSPTSLGKLINSNLSDIKDIYVNSNGSRVYMISGTSLTQPEFFIVDTFNSNSPTLVNEGSFETGIDPTGVTVVSGNKAIIVGKNGSDLYPEYQVINIENESSLSICTTNGTGTIRVPANINAISSVSQSDGHSYSYIVTGDTNAELKIIEGGTGGGGGGGTGIFESSTFDAVNIVAFNSFTATIDLNLSYKIAVKQAISGTCSSVTFSDSDFISYSIGPLNLIGQCLRYKVINSSQAPLQFTIYFNYSP